MAMKNTLSDVNIVLQGLNQPSTHNPKKPEHFLSYTLLVNRIYLSLAAY